MRRNLISAGTRNNFRSGVMARVMSRKRRVQSPVPCSRASTGFGPKPTPQLAMSVGWMPKNLQASNPTGTRHTMKTTTLKRRIILDAGRWLVVLCQVHSGIESGYLIIAVEHQGRTWPELTQSVLAGLAVIPLYVGIHVGIKAKVVGIGFVPCSVGLVLYEADFYDGLGALETILPGHDQAQRRAILISEASAIHSEAE